nr:immunoglobulin light chain junction region [Macaca mulatta]
CSQYISGVTF